MSNGTKQNRRYYRARAQAWALGNSKQKGTPQIAVTFTILTEGATHAALTWFGYFTDATTDRTIESLRHCGWQGDDLMQIAQGQAGDGTGMDNNEVELVVEDEFYDGNWSTKVQFVNRPGSGVTLDVMPPDRLQSFAASMRGHIRAFDAANKPKGGTAKPAAGGRPTGQPKPAQTPAQAWADQYQESLSQQKPPLGREPGSDDDEFDLN